MTTFTFPGYIVERTPMGQALSLVRTSVSIVVPEEDPVFRYERPVHNGQPDINVFMVSEMFGLRVGDREFLPAEARQLDAEAEQVRWPGGVANVFSFDLSPTSTVFIQLSGNPIPQFHTAAAYNQFLESVTGIRELDFGVFGPGVDIPLGNIMSASRSENDLINGGPGADELFGGIGSDTLNGHGGNDTLNGGDGADTIYGGNGDDLIFGGATAADLRDLIFGGNGDDTIYGGAGNDELHGGAGDDLIFGDAGADTLIGNSGNDTLSGGGLSDALFGGAGDDFLNGGFGFDRLNGGAGADTFFHLGVFDHGSDWIQDYNAAEGDVLQTGIVGATKADFRVVFANTPNAGQASVDEAFIRYIPSGQILFALVDGGGQSQINMIIGGQAVDLLS